MHVVLVGEVEAKNRASFLSVKWMLSQQGSGLPLVVEAIGGLDNVGL